MSIPSTGSSRDPAVGRRKGLGRLPLAVSVREACELLGCGNTKMWELIAAGDVKTLHLGRKRLVVYASLEALVASKAA